MKKIGRILSLTIVIVLLASSFSFAAGLELVSTYPEEGYNKLQPVNVAVKLVFSENMTSPEAQAANVNKFKITDAEGNVIEHETLYNADKYPNQVWLQIKEMLTDNMQYTLTISDDLQSSAGNTLEDSATLNFSTRDTAADNTGYMVLMVLMVIGMIGFSVWDARRQMKKQEKESGDFKVNPYKEAKKTGKSVEQIVAKTEKEKAVAEKRKTKSGTSQDAEDRFDETGNKEDIKKVKAPRPISAAGIAPPAAVIAKREAKEAKAREEEAKAAARKKDTQSQKSKGSKQRQKKKK